MPLDLSRLSPTQREAACAPNGPLLILAGPGSGKTTVLAARIAHLLLERHVDPSSLLALTFTTAAARTLRDRVVGLVGEAANASDISTFHSFGLRVARQWSEELGFGPGPLVVYDSHDSRQVVRDLGGGGGTAFPLPMRELARAIEAHRLRGEPTPLDGDSVIPRLAERYEAVLRRRGAVDYTAMLTLPLRLFRERPAALRLFQDAYRFILADEGQDVCRCQYELLCLLAARHRNLVLVGDPLQNVYAWRGADPRLALRFQQDFPDARVVELVENFRSTGRIVAFGNALGASLGFRAPTWTRNPDGVAPRLHELGDTDAESVWVAGEIARLLTDGHITGLGEVAVLYRTNAQAREVALALRERGLPYRVRGGGDLFASREVRDILAYLRLVANPDDSLALARIVNVPPRGLARAAQALRRQPTMLNDVPDVAQRCSGLAARQAAQRLVDTISGLRAQARLVGVGDLLALTIERTGYGAWLGALTGGAARVANLDQLRAYAARSDAKLETWLAMLGLGDEPDPADSHDRVLLTTIHAAKGGEWRIVFLVGAEDGLLPHARSLRPTDAAEAEDELLAAERRVAYVAVTRPRERLVITYCRERRFGERVLRRQPSRFLQAVSSDTLERTA